MSDHEEDEDNVPDDEDSTHSGEGDGEAEADVVVADADRDGDAETRGEDEDEHSSDDFFDTGEGAVNGPDRLSLRAASESGQSDGGSGTEDDPVGPVTPSAAISHNNKPTAVDFSTRTYHQLQPTSTTKSGWTRRLYHLHRSNLPSLPPSHSRSLPKLNRPASRRVGNGRIHARTRTYRSR